LKDDDDDDDDDEIRKDKVSGTCSMHGETRNASSTLVGKPEVKRAIG